MLRLIMPWALVFTALSPLVLLCQEPSFRTATALVIIPVAVHDRHGTPVRNLPRAEFTVLVDGHPVQLAGFESTATLSAPSTPETGVEPAPAPSFTNMRGQDALSGSGNLVILLVDFLNTSLADRLDLRTQTLKFLSHDLKPTERLGIYGLSSSLVVIQPFTRDPAVLATAARNMLQGKAMLSRDPIQGQPLDRPGIDPHKIEVTEGSDAAIELLSARSARIASNLDQFDRAARTLAEFRQLARAFSGIPGKKTVVWLTGDASPLNPSLLYTVLLYEPELTTLRTPWWQIAKTYELLEAAGISLFPVDARGLRNQGLNQASEGLTHDAFRQSIGESQATDESVYSSVTDMRQGEAANALLAMQTAAAETGGTVLQGSNDVAKLLAQAQGYWQSYYVLAIKPPPAGERATYHRITIKLAHKGLRPTTRRGFSVHPLDWVAADHEIQNDIAEVTQSELDATGLALRVTLQPAVVPEGRRTIPLKLQIGAADLTTFTRDTELGYDLTVATVIRDAQRRVLASHSERLSATFSHAKWAAMRQGSVPVTLNLDVPTATSGTARVLVRDNGNGRVGSVTFTLP